MNELVEVRLTGDEVGIRLAGDIDMANAGTVTDQLHAAISNRATLVVLDLSDVTYLDSAGLRVLSLLSRRLEPLQIQLRVIAPAGSPARFVLDVSGLTDLVHVDRT